MNLWKVKNDELQELPKSRLDSEDRLESWIAKDSAITGLEILLIGRQVVTAYGGRIDLLGMDGEGNLVILELKRDKTPRDIIAQALDYASWVRDLTYEQIEVIAAKYLKRTLREAFHEKFQIDLPEEINKNHKIVIVASELDPSSERIVQYLSSEYNVNINCIFFDFFREGDQEFLGRSWLMDPEEVEERTISKKRSPWLGLYFVNVGDGEHRSWEDCMKYGFLSAGQGSKYSRPIRKLEAGDKVLAYLKGRGYVGYGEVTSSAVMAKDFILPDNKKLSDKNLNQPNIMENCDDPDLADWTVGIKWHKAVSRDEAITKQGIFANPNVVCKLRDQQTIEFLKENLLIEKD
ncbi:DUF91 domain-containing protein [Metabacillus fastidiosus]|uniref:DUF91 domain-containing protein n=1 Tax=Metabacillus fastidiosus TaxID=1458 RepID=UPI002DBDA65B|nr:DUF91 domain-containing protein [Metabacillus fastidiosus]MEC2075947.1 endonuclease NucS [Metabacillus fastidiosus]